MLYKYITVMIIAMVPILELRGALPIAIGMGIPTVSAYIACVLGNIFPVPFIYLFARKLLTLGKDKPVIGKFCTAFLEKGEKGGRKLVAAAGRGGIFVALMLFVGIPLPGTGAWTGTLAASFLDLGIKTTCAAVFAGVVIAGVIMALASTGVFAIIGL